MLAVPADDGVAGPVGEPEVPEFAVDPHPVAERTRESASAGRQSEANGSRWQEFGT